MFFQKELSSENILLQQIKKSDFDRLFLAGSDPLIWAQHPDSERYQRSRFEVYFASGLEAPAFYKIVDRKTQEVIGSTRFYGYQKNRNLIELGYTFLVRKYWGGNTNLEVKKTLLEDAFQSVDRVIFTVGQKNFRSQRAMEKMGGRRINEPESLQLAGNLSSAVVYEIVKSQMNHIKYLYNVRAQSMEAGLK